jgi:hypothetical protein
MDRRFVFYAGDWAGLVAEIATALAEWQRRPTQ